MTNYGIVLKTLVMLVGLSSLACASSVIDHENNPKLEEIYRVKIWNLAGGTIEVSSDRGKTYAVLGSVLRPAERTNPDGYSASRWAEGGKVAATAVNAVHIKVSAGGDRTIFSLLPQEFAAGVADYKSYLNFGSSICTDIPAGQSIFGGDWTPFVGNQVMLSGPAGTIFPLPEGYAPRLGDKLYILVEQPVDYPQEMVFENLAGGKITVRYFNGEEKVIGRVLRPVTGIGRFEGTKYASSGRVRANHSGVIDVATSSAGKVGGFQIVPSRHGANMGVVRQGSQWMVVGPVEAEPSLEGQAPFFKYFIKPAWGAEDLESEDWENKLLGRFLVEVKFKGEDKWQPMPIYEFDDYYLTGSLPRWADSALQNAAAFRILFPTGEL